MREKYYLVVIILCLTNSLLFLVSAITKSNNYAGLVALLYVVIALFLIKEVKK
jgi:uncharacterized membrane protein YhaH (DUF805 family)